MDLISVRDGLLERLRTLNGGRFYTSLPDEMLTVTAEASHQIKPYGVLSLGVPYQSGRDRSIMANGMQPHVLTFSADCEAADEDSAWRMASAVTGLLVPPSGWAPAEGCSDVALIGGGSYRRKDSAGRPTRFIHTVTAETIINLSVEPPA